VPPRIFSGWAINRNSHTLSRARCSKFRTSIMCMPLSTSRRRARRIDRHSRPTAWSVYWTASG
jgi:hypothetical protein